MADYEDDSIVVDEQGIRIKSYRRPGDSKFVPFGDIGEYEVFEMGFWTGRHQLVGLSPGRPRNWFHWDRKRRDKTTAIGLEVGGWIRPTIVPDDATSVAELLRAGTERP
jgi:hypothetical protein